jgi:osmotically-inducible protein OsmY
MTMPTRFRTLALFAVLFAATGACNRQASQDVAGDASVPAQERTTDASIETSVEARLYADDSIRGEGIDVSADDGVVTLRGAVSNDAAKQQAVTIAGDVDGVTRVDDQLTLESQGQATRSAPTPYRSAEANNAAWITTKIQAQYFVNPDIKPWNVDVTTSSAGVVELRGEVESAQAKSEAVRIARATEGVRGVEDHLRVRSDTSNAGDLEAAAEDFGDAWLTAKVQAKYFLDEDIKARDIDVATQDRVVTLSGTVDSELERRQAVAIAQNTDGVRSVRDQLRLGGSSASSDGDARGTAGTRIVAGVEDPWITTKIQSKYFLDPDVKGHRIDVDTRNGIVTLTGSVASEMRKDLAEQIARETDGVTRVVNRLMVMTES